MRSMISYTYNINKGVEVKQELKNKTYSKILKRARQSAGLSLRDAAKALTKDAGLCICHQTIDNIEKNKHALTVDWLIRMARFYQIPLGCFFAQKHSVTGNA